MADVIELCGVSRSDFYKHFANKAECLAAAAEALLEPTLEALGAIRDEGDGENAEEIFEKFIGLVQLSAGGGACLLRRAARSGRGGRGGRRPGLRGVGRDGR